MSVDGVGGMQGATPSYNTASMRSSASEESREGSTMEKAEMEPKMALKLVQSAAQSGVGQKVDVYA